VLELDWRIVAALAALLLLLWTLLLRKWSAWRRSALAHKRSARAARGERNAEKLLEVQGYEILERQLSEEWTMSCDDEPLSFLLRADLLVRKDERDYIAEVKTGSSAPDLRNASTRRQLLEYAIAYDSPTILLVDVEAGVIQEVRFPLMTSEQTLD